MALRRNFGRIMVLSSIFIACFAAANAQATRTWISGVGDDANPCSRTAPCKTFAGAISKTATGGEINCLDPGGFGAVTITKSITLDCKNVNGSVLASGTQGIIINNSGAVVRIRGLNINGAGTAAGTNGISIVNASRVNIEDVVIDGFAQSGISLGTNSATSVFVSNTTIRNVAGNAIGGVPTVSADITVVDSRFTGNGTALLASANVIIRIAGNSVFYNTTGLLAQTRGQILSFGNNFVNNNGTDGTPSGTILAR